MTYWPLTKANPYSPSFGVKAVQHLEHEIPFLRLIIQEGLAKEENI